jgi:hypothetical protein
MDKNLMDKTWATDKNLMDKTLADKDGDVGYAIQIDDDWQDIERQFSNDELMNPYAYSFADPRSYTFKGINRELNAFNVVGVVGRTLQVMFGGYWLFVMTTFVCGIAILVVLQLRFALTVVGVL